MNRFAPYFGTTVAILVGVLLVAFSGSVTVERTPALSAASTSTAPAVIPISSPTPALLPLASEAATTTNTATPKEIIVSPASAAPSSSATKTVSTLVPPAPPENADATLNASASLLRAALVNIICYVPAGSGLHSISGSGIFIDAKGVILTNAHIAQYFLLANRGVSCTVRTGSPAVDSYQASLIYIPPIWLNTNVAVLTQTQPSGTGEYDFALLAVTKSETAQPLPSSFPFIPLAITPPSSGTPVVIASYGAQFLETSQVQSSLFPTVVFGSVKDVFTFAKTTIDVLALGGSAAAQEGSSGGGVSDASGNLAGTIVTSTVEGATNTRALNAITASYIRSEYASETGDAIDLLLAEPTATAIADFAPQIPALESIITAQLP